MGPPRRKQADDDDGAVEISVPNDDLYRELSSHNDFFDALVDMLPAKLYVSGHPTGDETYNPKYRKGQHKESKEARKARNKASKREKFNPKKAETTLETKRRLDHEKEEEEEGEDDSGDEAIVDAHEEEQDQPAGAGQDASSAAPLPTGDGDGASRIEALRARLRAKIAERQGSRPGAGDPEHVSKRAARRSEKRKRVEEAKKRKAQQGGQKSGGKSEADKQARGKQYTMAGGGTRVNSADPSRDAGATQDLHGVDFGSIAGLRDRRPAYLDNKSLSGAGKKKSLDRLLAEAEKKADRLKELKSSQDDDDKAKAKKIAWGDTLKEATGHRIRDDPALIKKAMKRKERKKERSAKAWGDRKKATRDEIDERQKIRGHNLNQRKLGGAAAANLSKKRIKDDEEGGGRGGKSDGGAGGKKEKRQRMGPHAGQGRAGFEGRKSDFINGGKGGDGKKGGEKAPSQ